MNRDARGSMSQVRGNLLANLFGNAWTPLIMLLCIPFYTTIMGIEAFGLVGFFLTVSAIANPLGAGLANALNRELARLSVLAGKGQEMRDLTRTLEMVYWLLAVAAGLLVTAAAPVIAHHWIRPERLTPQVVTIAVLLMGLTLTLQFPNAFYSSGLAGLQNQVALSVCNMVMNTLRFGGAAVVLAVVSPTITMFFCWQAGVGALHTVVLRAFLWKNLPRTGRGAAFRIELLKEVATFVSGTTVISLSALVLTQLDKVILSRVLSLEMFGYYALASMVAMSLYFIVGSVFTALSPRLAQLVSLGDDDHLKALYHLACQVMSVLVLPVAVVGALFSKELLLLWTGDPVQAEYTYLVLSLLLIGNALNGLVNLPYALQLAHGCTSIALTMNLAAMVLMIPLIVVMTMAFGPVGAAGVWVALNVFYVLVGVGITHRRFLPGQSARWYVHGVLAPLAASAGVALAARWIVPADLGRWAMLGCLAAVGLVCLVATTLAAPAVREALLLHLRRRTAARDAAG